MSQGKMSQGKTPQGKTPQEKTPQRKMAQTIKKSRSKTHAILPTEVWINILNKLTATDLSIVSKASKAFSALTQSTIDLYHRHDSPFTCKNEFSFLSVAIEPAICPTSNYAICFREGTNELKVLNLATGESVASAAGCDSYPVSVTFSRSGNFLKVCYDNKIRVYLLNLAIRELCVSMEMRFDVPIPASLPPGNGRRRYGMGRMLVSLSANEKMVAFAHLDVSGTSQLRAIELSKNLIFKCLTTDISDLERGVIVDFGSSSLSSTSKTVRTMNVCLKTQRTSVNLMEIEMNAEPLRFYLPPECTHSEGFLLNPTTSVGMISHRILEVDPELGELIRCCFSPCGQYLLEARKELCDEIPNVTIRKFHLVTACYEKVVTVPIIEYEEVLGILFSNNGRLAVIIQGEYGTDSTTATTWHVANLIGEGMVNITCREPILTSQDQDFLDTFNLSNDGQLLAVSCDAGHSNTSNTVKVFQTATGLSIDSLTCAVPSGGQQNHEGNVNGRALSHHAFGGQDKPTLTMYTLRDSKVSFANAS